VNILNNQLQSAEKGLPVGVGEGPTTPHHERNQYVNKVLMQGLGLLTD